MEDILYIANGVRLTKADMTIGNRPFVGASEVCNGVTEFVGNANAREVLGVNYNGSVCFSLYHPYEVLFSDDVKRVRCKNENANNKHTLFYLSTSIAQQRRKYICLRLYIHCSAHEATNHHAPLPSRWYPQLCLYGAYYACDGV